MYDELELDKLGDRKTALFLIMSDTDSTFNFLISMIYTQLFNLLCDKADDQYSGKLPVHVRCLIDECANIGQIPQLEKLVATIRSREISACLVLQTRSQLKAIYKDNADTIVGNMDAQIFLGGSEPTTLKELSEALGKETIDSFNTSDTRGNSPSYGTSFQKLGHELMSRDELAVQLADCYRNSLVLAKTYDIHSIAFPAISTGVYGYPLDAATQIAVDTVTDWLQNHADYDMRAIFCCFDARTAQAYQTKMKMG